LSQNSDFRLRFWPQVQASKVLVPASVPTSRAVVLKMMGVVPLLGA